jgi:hypothetical protein
MQLVLNFSGFIMLFYGRFEGQHPSVFFHETYITIQLKVKMAFLPSKAPFLLVTFKLPSVSSYTIEKNCGGCHWLPISFGDFFKDLVFCFSKSIFFIESFCDRIL